jgi:hypothetical protein
MQAIRTRIRMVALLWLLGQVGTLAAFVPENCCIAHANERAAKETQEACHETEPAEPEPGDACPMQHGHHSEGAACPMHDSKSANCCVMSNACDGPGQHLTTLFSYMATVDRPLSAETLLDSTLSVHFAASPRIHRPTTPDAPPPKA